MKQSTWDIQFKMVPILRNEWAEQVSWEVAKAISDAIGKRGITLSPDEIMFNWSNDKSNK